MEPRISLITLVVKDLEQSITFYRDGLGLQLRDGSGAKENIVFFEKRSTWLALYSVEAFAADAIVPAERSGFGGITLAHNFRSGDEVDALLVQAQAAGATLVKAADDTDWGGYSGYFTDPDDYLWEIAWNPHFWIE